jgi:hypothetical protein
MMKVKMTLYLIYGSTYTIRCGYANKIYGAYINKSMAESAKELIMKKEEIINIKILEIETNKIVDIKLP